MAEESLTVHKGPADLGRNHREGSYYTSGMACESLSGAKPHSRTCILHYSEDVAGMSFPRASKTQSEGNDRVVIYAEDIVVMQNIMGVPSSPILWVP